MIGLIFEDVDFIHSVLILFHPDVEKRLIVWRLFFFSFHYRETNAVMHYHHTRRFFSFSILLLKYNDIIFLTENNDEYRRFFIH